MNQVRLLALSFSLAISLCGSALAGDTQGPGSAPGDTQVPGSGIAQTPGYSSTQDLSGEILPEIEIVAHWLSVF